MTLRPYGHGERDTGVVAYDLGPDWIRCQFSDGSVYLYDGTRPGTNHVAEMKRRAIEG